MNEWFTGAQGAKEVLLSPLRLLAAIAICGLSLSSILAQGISSSNSRAHENQRAAQVRVLNNSVLQLHGQIQEDASGAAALRGQAATVLAQRAAALRTLMQEDAHAALSFAFSPELLADLAEKFPASATALESHVTLSGALEHWVADSADLKTSQDSWTLITGGEKLNLHFSKPKDSNLEPGSRVVVEGVRLASDVAVSKVQATRLAGLSGGPSRFSSVFGGWRSQTILSLFAFAVLSLTFFVRRLRRAFQPKRLAVCCATLAMVLVNPFSVSAQSVCSTTGTQNVAVLLVTFPGITPPASLTQQSVYDMFFGSGSSLDSYWKEVSYGQAGATGSVYGWYTLSGSYSCSNVRQFMDDAIATAAGGGVDFNFYHRVSIIFPDMNPSCGWAGISGIGCTTEVTSSGTFEVSISALPWTKLAPAVIFHENGHELGLAHARLRTFDSDILGPIGATGTLTEYGDHYSAMGVANQGHYAAGQKAEILGWLSATNYQSVSAGGTFTIQPYETSPGGLTALKIQRGTGNPGYYLWVEYRQPVGSFDPTMPYSAEPSGNVFTGALIHYEDSATGIQTDLLDFTNPDTYADFPALRAGQSWTDPYSDLSLSVVSATSSGLTLNVSYTGNVPCTSLAPSLTLSPADPSLYPGQNANYTVTVTNNDSSTCAASTTNLASSEPSGWSTALSSS